MIQCLKFVHNKNLLIIFPNKKLFVHNKKLLIIFHIKKLFVHNKKLFVHSKKLLIIFHNKKLLIIFHNKKFFVIFHNKKLFVHNKKLLTIFPNKKLFVDNVTYLREHVHAHGIPCGGHKPKVQGLAHHMQLNVFEPSIIAGAVERLLQNSLVQGRLNPLVQLPAIENQMEQSNTCS